MVKNLEDRIFNAATTLLLALVGIATHFPVLYVVTASITPYSEVLKNGGYVIIPNAITFEAYRQFLDQSCFTQSLQVSVFITVVGTLLNLLFTALLAYPLSRKDLPGRGFLLLFILFPYLFSGGLIPTYMVVKDTGLYNTVWAMIIPGMVWTFNVFIMKAFFEGLPEELIEAARIDGASELRILTQIILPLSKPIFLTVGLFYGVAHWNEFFQAVFYTSDRGLQPLQVLVRGLLLEAQSSMDASANVPSVTL